MDKNFNIGDNVYLIEHSVYGDPNGKVNEPSILHVTVMDNASTIEDGKKYHLSGVNTRGMYFSDGTDLFKTNEEAQEYINEHRDEIISKSFKEHDKWFKDMLKKARNIN